MTAVLKVEISARYGLALIPIPPSLLAAAVLSRPFPPSAATIELGGQLKVSAMFERDVSGLSRHRYGQDLGNLLNSTTQMEDDHQISFLST